MEAAGVLSVAFGLGLLLHASQTAFFATIKGHTETLFLHRRRLVLLSFLLCVSIFSITQFSTLLLLENNSCSVAVRFALFFDQAARVAALALIVWKVCDEACARAEAVMWVSVIVLRILMGGIMVGFTGITFMPVCFPEPMHMVVGIVHTVFDCVVWVMLGWRIVQVWMLFVDQHRGGKSQGYGLFFVVLAFMAWTIASFPYMLGVGDSIFARMIPYILTLALALIVLSCTSCIFSTPAAKVDDPYKLSQFNTSSPPRRGRSASSPTFNPGDMEANKYKPYTGIRNSQMFRGVLGMPIVHPGTALPWSLDTDVDNNVSRPKPTQNRRPSAARSHGGKTSISGPIGPILSFDVAEDGGLVRSTSNPFGRVKTVDLKTAAEASRQRIDATFEREHGRREPASPNTVKSFSATAPKLAEYKPMERTTSVKRKPVTPQLSSGPAAYRVSAVSGGVTQSGGQSVYGAEGSDWGMQYSIHANSILSEDDDTTTRYTTVSHAPYILAPGPPRIPLLQGVDGGAKVMFMSEIVYDDPALVKSIMGKTDTALTTSRWTHSPGTAIRRSPSSAAKRIPGMLTPTKEVDEPSASLESTPVIERPRSVKREQGRGIFPPDRDSAITAEMKYKKRQLTASIGSASSATTVPTRSLLPPPMPQITVKKPARKSAPPPITIAPATFLSPEIVQKVVTPELAPEDDVEFSPVYAIPAKSEKRLLYPKAEAYETAKAWVDSVSAAGSSNDTYTITPLAPVAYAPSSSTSSVSLSSVDMGGRSLALRRSLLSLTTSPKLKAAEDDGAELTDIEIDSEDEIEDEEMEEEQTPSEAGEMIMSGGSGYSTPGDSEDCITESDADGDEADYIHGGVIITDSYDSTEALGLAAEPEEKEDHIAIPPARHFQPGDRIPAFSARYGSSRRKPPPSPIAFLLRRQHESAAHLSGDSLLARLEAEMGQQESRWLDLKKVLDSKRSSVASRRSLLGKLDRRVSVAQKTEGEEMVDRMEYLVQAPSYVRVGEEPMKPVEILESQHTPISVISESEVEIRESEVVQYEEVQEEEEKEEVELICSYISPLQATVYCPSLHSPSIYSPSTCSSLWSPYAFNHLWSPLPPSPPAPHTHLWTPHTRPTHPGAPAAQTSTLRRVRRLPDAPLQVHTHALWSHSLAPRTAAPTGLWQRTRTSRTKSVSFLPNTNTNTITIPASPKQRPLQRRSSTTKYAHKALPPLPNCTTLSAAAPSPAAQLLWARSERHGCGDEAETMLWPAARGLLVELVQGVRSMQAPCALELAKLESDVLWRKNVEVEVHGLWRKSIRESKSALWPHGDRDTGVFSNLWPSAPSVTVEVEVTDLSRTKREVTLARLESGELWMVKKKKEVEVYGLWSQSISDSKGALLWPHGDENTRVPSNLWPSAPSVVVEVADRLSKTKREVMLARLESRELWMAKKKEVEVHGLWSQSISDSKSALLWPHENGDVGVSRNLWPSAPSVVVEVADRLSRTKREVALTRLESEELWMAKKKEVEVHGLWSQSISDSKSALLWPHGDRNARVFSNLWPSAPSVAVEVTDRLSKTKREVTLARLESEELWMVKKKEVEVYGLWSRSISDSKSALLWPHGNGDARVSSNLWPSAPPVTVEVEMTDRLSRTKREVALARLESGELWMAKKKEVEVHGLWSQSISDSKSTLLWPHENGDVGVSSNLWPSAPSVAVEVTDRLSRTKREVMLARLESEELWMAKKVEVEVHGLWSRSISESKSALWPHGNGDARVPSNLWPSAPPVTMEVEVTDLSRTKREVALTRLESRELWMEKVEVEAHRLWSQSSESKSKSMLWPHGKVLKVTSSLWPSAPSVEKLGGRSVRYIRERLEAIAVLESTALWNGGKEEAMVVPEAVHQTIPEEEEEVVEEEISTPPLWTSPQSPRTTTPSTLWPSALSLPVLPNTPTTRHTRPATTALVITSTTLWTSASASASASRSAHLWAPAATTTTLWPHAQLTTALWPRARTMSLSLSLSLSLTLPPRAPRLRIHAGPGEIRSRVLWPGLEEEEKVAALWAPAPKVVGMLWPHGAGPAAKEKKKKQGLWPATGGKVGGGSVDIAVRRRERCADPVSVSGELWHAEAQAPAPWQGALWAASDWRCWAPIDSAAIESKSVGLWARSLSPIGAPAVGLWPATGSLGATHNSPTTTTRTRTRTRTRTTPPSSSYIATPSPSPLLPAQGLWGSLLPNTNAGTWRPAPRETGLWSCGGTTQTLAALAEWKTYPLWRRHARTRSIFSHLPRASRASKRRPCSPPVLATGPLWALTPAPAPATADIPRGGTGLLWAPASAGVSRLLVIAGTAHTLWQQPEHTDQPQAPLTPVRTPARPRSSRKTDPPLCLAPTAGRRMLWVDGTTRELELWRPRRRGGISSMLWPAAPPVQLTRTPTLLWSASSPSPSSPSSSPSASLFSSLSTSSIRTTQKQKHINTITMSGSLWSSSAAAAAPSLWRAPEEDQSLLWPNVQPTASSPAPPLWPRTTAIFTHLPNTSLRSHHSHTPKTLASTPTGLWTPPPVQPVQSVQEHTGLWRSTTPAPVSVRTEKENETHLWPAAAPMFSTLPTDSHRSKKPHAATNTPVFDEGLWRTAAASSAQTQQLWKPRVEPAHLWSGTTGAATLAQILEVRKQPLWAREHARRTTELRPTRAVAVVQRVEKKKLVKVGGSLWAPATTTTTTAAAAAERLRLWTPLKRAVRTVASYRTALLWAAETAERRTERKPERGVVKRVVPKITAVTVTGTLWQPAAVAVGPQLWSKKVEKRKVGLWGALTAPTTTTTTRSTLWAPEHAARTTDAAPTQSSTAKRATDTPLPVVSGPLWRSHSEKTKKKTLWTPTTTQRTTTTTTTTTTSAPLWAKEHAARTTTAVPTRGPTITNLRTSLDLTAASGPMWSPAPAPPPTLWTQPPAPAGLLWGASSGRRSPPPKQQSTLWTLPTTTTTTTTEQQQQGIWRPVSPVLTADVLGWLTRDDDDDLEPTLSRASTVSDVSEVGSESESESEHDFGDGDGPRIERVHSTKASISSTGAEAMWAREVAKEAVKEAEGLWRPKTQVWAHGGGDTSSEEGEEDFHDAVSEEFHDASSQLSRCEFEAGHYQYTHQEHQHQQQQHNHQHNQHVVLGQFRRDTYIPQQDQTLMPEDSPFRGRLRIGSLRRKLKPTRREEDAEGQGQVGWGLWGR